MDYSHILKRSWNILWSYRALWIFGIIIALTTPRGNNSGGSGRGSGSSNTGNFFNRQTPDSIRREFSKLAEIFNQWFDAETQRTMVIIAITVMAVLMLIGLVMAVGRYVSQTAMIRMVDRYESSGVKVSWREGFRLGWSRSAWRLFLTNLVIFLPLFVVILLMIGSAFLPVILGMAASTGLTWAGVVSSIGLAMLVGFVIFLVVTALSLVMEIISRVVVLQETGVIEGIRLGLNLVKDHFKDVVLMWLILIGVQLGYLLVLIPALLIVGTVSFLVSGGVGTGVYFLSQVISDPTTGWIVAGIAGLILFITLLAIPMVFLGGLLETYLSTAWTLAYRSVVKSVVQAERTIGDPALGT